jgi:hypothetical protein
MDGKDICQLQNANDFWEKGDEAGENRGNSTSPLLCELKSEADTPGSFSSLGVWTWAVVSLLCLLPCILETSLTLSYFRMVIVHNYKVILNLVKIIIFPACQLPSFPK